MFNLTQSFLEGASGVGTKAVALNPKSPGSMVLTTEKGWGAGGGLVVVEVGTTLIFSTRSGKSAMEDEVLSVEWTSPVSLTKWGEEFVRDSPSA